MTSDCCAVCPSALESEASCVVVDLAMSSSRVPPPFLPLLLLVLLPSLLVPVCLAAEQDLQRHGCFAWYSEQVNVSFDSYKRDESKRTIPATPDESLSMTTTVKLTDSDCKGDVKRLEVTLTNGEKHAEVILDLRVMLLPNRHWHLDENGTEVTVTIGEKKARLSLRNTHVTAGSRFSFSCSRLLLKSPRASFDTPWSLEMKIHRFQLQPFKTDDTEKGVFADSFDCSTWFTIPVWTGFLILLFFTAILAFGIFALLEIKTPDRFENPKGKTITVSATD